MNFDFYPSFAEFQKERKNGFISPVWVDAVADSITPISAFQQLGFNKSPSFLLESAEWNDHVGRYSFVGYGSRLIFRGSGNLVKVTFNKTTYESYVEDNPFDEFRRIFLRYKARNFEELPGCWGGAVGYLSFDAIRWFEPTVTLPPPDDLYIPDCFFVIPEIVVIFDHRRRRLRVVFSVFPEDGHDEESYRLAREKISECLTLLSRPIAFPLLEAALHGEEVPLSSNTSQEEFLEMVTRAKEFIRAGDIFQVVLSQRFSAPFNGDAIELYRALRFINPSPYMFCIRCGEGIDLVGCSPEMNVRLTNHLIEIRPIAGTRRRGNSPEEDSELAAELLADPKERAEHVMLVDLARNDIGRIAHFGSVRVQNFMTIEKYSHVMHIVSHVS
ncbi:MAG: chorismate-binding protein, partial [Chthoniobacterales bacterium]|nr:chorismate-binding protein [Chthoniobacterales bacterium]